jgi:DNA-binding NarL/FixJ family response regulator
LQAYLDRAGVLEQAGDAEGVARVALEGRDEAARRGLSATTGAVLTAVAANGLLGSGAWDEAAELLAGADPAPGTRLETGTGMVAVVHARLACGRGEWDLADRRLADARSHLTDPGQPGWGSIANLVTAEMAIWRRHYADGRAAVALGIDLAERQGDRMALATLAWIGIRLEADAAAAATRRPRRDATPSDEIATGHWVRLRVDPVTDDGTAPEEPSARARALVRIGAAELGRLRSDLGSLAGPPGQLARWDAAVAAWERAGDPSIEAYARLRRAEETLAQGADRAAAATDLRTALGVAERLGAAPLAREVEQLARRARLAGVREGAAAIPSRDPGYAEARRLGLSDREIEVLALVAAGLPDREIAERLFITTKTTGHHVSHILAKLGAERRGEAAVVAFRIGLVGGDRGPAGRDPPSGRA